MSMYIYQGLQPATFIGAMNIHVIYKAYNIQISMYIYQGPTASNCYRNTCGDSVRAAGVRQLFFPFLKHHRYIYMTFYSERLRICVFAT